MASFYTYANLKTLAANLTGRTDGGTANTLRDNFINYVIRDIVDAFPFSWTRRSTTLSINASGQADLPADYNPLHGVFDLRQVQSGAQDDYIYGECRPEELDYTLAGDYNFSLDYNTSTSRYRVNTKQTNSPTLTVIYHFYPVDLSSDSDATIVPDPQAIGYKVGAKLWLTKERDETNHDRYDRIGDARISMMITRDNLQGPVPGTQTILDTADLGFNRASSSSNLSQTFGSK